jgi:hypothetical protein
VPINQISANHYKPGVKAIDVGDCKFEIGGLLREVLIFGVHSELRVGHDCEKPGLLGSGCNGQHR